jgi:hypothetical protein
MYIKAEDQKKQAQAAGRLGVKRLKTNAGAT